MNFKCNKTELSEVIGYVSRAVSQKSTIPALEGIKVKVSPGEIELTAYNLEMGIRTTISAETNDSGEFVVSPRLFNEFTRRMSGDVISFDISEILLETEQGMLNVKGKDLHVNRLNLEKGEADIEGVIDALSYSQVPTSLKKTENPFGKWFK